MVRQMTLDEIKELDKDRKELERDRKKLTRARPVESLLPPDKVKEEAKKTLEKALQEEKEMNG